MMSGISKECINYENKIKEIFPNIIIYNCELLSQMKYHEQDY